MGHSPPPIDQDSYLAANFATELCETAGKLVVEEGIRVEPAAKQALELSIVAGLEALGIAVYLDG